MTGHSVEAGAVPIGSCVPGAAWGAHIALIKLAEASRLEAGRRTHGRGVLLAG